MIGQKHLQKLLDFVTNYGFPRFAIIYGPKGSGKKLIASQIAQRLQAQYIVCGTKVDDVREVITLAYKQTNPTVYFFPDADRMSPAAKNALLKVTEEAPRKAYFLMSLVDLNSTLDTLKSRGYLMAMDGYSYSELLEYAAQKGYHLTEGESKIVTNICTVPGELDLLMRYQVQDFYNFVCRVVDNIGIVNGANAFKIGTKLAYKEEDVGWDITLFLRAVMLVFREKADEINPGKCRESIRITSQYLSEINSITGINKSSTIDMWILDLRGVWVE